MTYLAPGKVGVCCIKARPHSEGLDPSQVVDALRRVGGVAQRGRARLPQESVVIVVLRVRGAGIEGVPYVMAHGRLY